MPYFYSPDERASKTLFDDITARTFWGREDVDVVGGPACPLGRATAQPSA
jgi:hypothetical protein